jgi:cation diffusion facilitator CzcD-associated flavoprotein CzcO
MNYPKNEVIAETAQSAAPRLAELAERVRQEIEFTNYPTVDWVQPVAAPDGSAALDCLIIGAGQFGVALANALQLERVKNILVLDENSPGSEGPWSTFARMETLRTPKTLTGPDLGLPGLTFRSWCNARYGDRTWEGLDRIPRTWWMDYLTWYRAVLALPVQNESRVVSVEPIRPDLFRVEVNRGAHGNQTLFARIIIFATGAAGSGQLIIAPVISDTVPKHLYAHSNEPIDFVALRGKRIGILGAGASAFDNGATALEAGAKEAHLFFRRAALPRDNPRRWMEFSGFLAHYPELSDEERWAYMHRLYSISQPPPSNTFARATQQAGFHLHAGTPWDAIDVLGPGEGVRIRTPNGNFDFDFLISATGIEVDLSMRPEFANILPGIKLWRDVYAPPSSLQNDRLGRFPYLGRFGDLCERSPGQAPWAERLFCIFRGATLSLGPSAASNSNMKYTLPRLVSGVTRQLFLDARRDHFEKFVSGDHAELRAV